ITYMRLHNESVRTRDPLGELFYSREKIERTAAGDDPVAYPQTDWRDYLMKDYTMNQRLNLSINGGGRLARYYVSGAFNQDNGVLNVDKRNNFNNNINLKTYSLRANVNMDLTSTTEFMVRLNGSFDDYKGPIDGGTKVYRDIMRTNPVMFAPYYEPGENHRFVRHIMFGNYEDGNYLNPYANMVKGYKDYSRSMMLAQVELQQQLSFITEGLSFRTMANTTRNSFFDVTRQYNPFYYHLSGTDRATGRYMINIINEDSGTEYLDYSEGNKNVSSVFYMESALNYARTFQEKHALSGLLVHILRQTLDANAGDLQQSLPYRNTGLSGRFTYSFDGRYFAEFNFGYNGSERFYKTDRFGFFPSAGLAWSISNEKFWEPLRATVSNLRLRATYGLVGNDAIGSAQDRFFYLSNVNMNDPSKGAGFGVEGDYRLNGISIDRYPNTDITWETATKTNIALELGLFDRVQLMADYFTEHRRNILMTRSSIPGSMGLTVPIRANVGEALGRGLDLSVDYSQNFAGGMWVQARANFTYATSEYKVYEEPQYQEWYLSRVGYPLSQQWGYIAERLFVDDEEVLSMPRQNFGPYMGGDIKYRDVNNDGQITALDQVPIGYPTTPEIVYGFGFSTGYRNFDFSAFFQGLGRESFWINPAATAPFGHFTYSGESFPAGTVLQNQLLKAYADNHWSEENRNLYALWPRLSHTRVANNEVTSTWFMRNGAFLRLKQVELGYTLPAHTAQRLRLDNLRLYLSGTNLLLWSKFKLWDVEMAGNGLGYPIQRVFNLGLQANL
ncbi:MAG: TonB-dependent receptor, partial [Solitalea sp.]